MRGCSTRLVASWIAAGLTLVVAGESVAGQSDRPLPSADGLACAPRLGSLDASPVGRLVGAPDNALQQLFKQGDAVLIDVGASSGVAVGTQFFMRRRVPVMAPALRDRGMLAELTTGWLRTVEVEEHAALAVIERTCADVQQDDQLAPFQWPAPVTPMATGAISYDDPATVLFGADGRSLSAAGQLFVIDQGTDHGLAIGQRVTIFRHGAAGPDGPVIELGEGIAVLAEATSATIHLSRSRQSVKTGDRVAMQRP